MWQAQFLFLAYTSTFPQVVDSQLNIYGFVDDHNLGCGFILGTLDNKDELEKINILTHSLKSINTWMSRNRLQMNNAKTEVLLISQSQLNKCVTSAWNVNGTMVQISRMIKYLGAFLDNGLTFKHHITTKCTIAMWNLQWLKPLWPSLPCPSLYGTCPRIGYVPSGLSKLSIYWSSCIRHK